MEEFQGLSEEKKIKLLKILKKPELASHRAHVVSSHYDPDSIACIMMMKVFLESFVKCAEIYLPGRPDNFVQNAEIVNQFGLGDLISQINEDFIKKIQPGDLIVFVDTPAFNDSRFGKVAMPRPHIVIDHHTRPAEMLEQGEEEWYWYDSCGACVSMIAKLLLDLDVFKNIEEKNLRKIATLGVLGILGDAKKLTSRYTKTLDYEMSAFLRKYADQEKIYQVSFSEYKETFLDSLGVASDRWERKGTLILFRADGLDSSLWAEGNMPKIAELLMKFEEVQTVYVWALMGNKILVKARNSNKDLNLDSELKRFFGEKNGGAKDNSSGAAFVDLVFFSNPPEQIKNEFLHVCDAFMKQKIFGK